MCGSNRYTLLLFLVDFAMAAPVDLPGCADHRWWFPYVVFFFFGRGIEVKALVLWPLVVVSVAACPCATRK